LASITELHWVEIERARSRHDGIRITSEFVHEQAVSPAAERLEMPVGGSNLAIGSHGHINENKWQIRGEWLAIRWPPWSPQLQRRTTFPGSEFLPPSFHGGSMYQIALKIE